ncbi:tenascin-N-like, partial [Saccoglossus kowalevskii]|uniref:Fibronectin-like n=1 Tax=Saccoglossus kowalevskii TaxID=10224 RepID=A0ABM0M5F3_SACKO
MTQLIILVFVFLTTITHKVNSESVQNLVVSDITTISIRLTWNLPSVTGTLSYYVFISPAKVDGTSSEITTSNDYTVDGLLQGTTYTFTVLLFVDGVAGESTQVTANTLSDAVPDPPSSLTVTATTGDSISLAFTPPTVGVYDSYRLTYTPSGGSESDPITINRDETTYTIDGLTSDVEYTISMVTVSGPGALAKFSTTVTTTATPVDFVLTITGVSGSFMLVTWEDLPGSYDSTKITYADESDPTNELDAVSVGGNQAFASGLSPGTAYIVTQYTVSGGNKNAVVIQKQYTKPNPVTSHSILAVGENTMTISWSDPVGGNEYYRVSYAPDNGLTPESNDVVDGSNTFEFEGLDPGTDYTITIVTVAGNQESEGYEFTQTTLPGTPAGINIKSVNYTSIQISFNEYPQATNYLVSISPADSASEVYTSTDIRQHTFTGLIPGREYTVIVSSQAPDNPEDQTKTVRTKLGMSGEITYDQDNITPNIVVFSWVAADGDVEYYDVSIVSQDGSISYSKTVNPTTHGTTASFSSLAPETTYTISVVTAAGSGDSKVVSYPQTIQINTLPTVLTVSQPIGETYLLLQWSPIVGDFDEYKLSYSPSGGDPDSPFTVSKTTPIQLINNLNPGEAYLITLYTVASDGTELERGSIEQRTKPQPPSSITIDSVSETTSKVIWTGPALSSNVFDKYLLTYSPVNGLTQSPMEVPSDISKVVLEGLTPATSYTVTVQTISGTLHSSVQQEEFTTTGTSFAGYIIEVTETTLWIKWSPDIDATGYQIRVIGTNSIFLESGDLSSTTKSYTFTGLDSGIRYSIFLSAVGGSTITLYQYT